MTHDWTQRERCIVDIEKVGRGTIANQWKRKNNIDPQAGPWSQHHRNARWASATGFVLAQGTHQAEEQRENQFKQCSDGEQTCKTTSCISITPSECSLSKEQSCFSFSIDSLWFPARRCDISGTLVVPLVVFVVLDSLLGVPIALFFWQGTLAWRDAYAWCRFASLFSVAALLKLIFSLFFRLMSPLSKDETGRGCSPCIPVVLWSWTCLWIDVVFPFPLIRYGSPPGGAISLAPLVVFVKLFSKDLLQTENHC